MLQVINFKSKDTDKGSTSGVSVVSVSEQETSLVKDTPSSKLLYDKALSVGLALNLYDSALYDVHSSGNVVYLKEKSVLLKVHLLQLVHQLVFHLVWNVVKIIYRVKRLLQEQFHVVLVVVHLVLEFTHKLRELVDQLIKVLLRHLSQSTVVVGNNCCCSGTSINQTDFLMRKIRDKDILLRSGRLAANLWA